MIEVTGGQPLTISGITVRTWAGSGYIGGSYSYQSNPIAISVVNQGTIVAENGNTLTIFASSFTQQGVLRADANSSLVVRQTSGAESAINCRRWRDVCRCWSVVRKRGRGCN